MFILVGGWPGSGKTTLATALGPWLGLPVLAKDEVKEVLADEFGRPATVSESRRLGRARSPRCCGSRGAVRGRWWTARGSTTPGPW